MNRRLRRPGPARPAFPWLSAGLAVALGAAVVVGRGPLQARLGAPSQPPVQASPVQATPVLLPGPGTPASGSAQGASASPADLDGRGGLEGAAALAADARRGAVDPALALEPSAAPGE